MSNIKEFDVTLRVAIDISAYNFGASGWQVIPVIKSINMEPLMDYPYCYQHMLDIIFATLANDDPEYNEAIKSVKEAAEDRSVIDPRD